MKNSILFFIGLAAVGVLNGQTPVTIIHGEGSQLFYAVTGEGYYQIQSSEVWLNPGGSQTFIDPQYVPVAPPLDQTGGPMPVGRMTCQQAHHFAQTPGAYAECGPTRSDPVPGTNDRTLSCLNNDIWMCKLQTFTPAGIPVTYWGFEFP